MPPVHVIVLWAVFPILLGIATGLAIRDALAGEVAIGESIDKFDRLAAAKHAADERKNKHIDEMRVTLPPADFEMWRRKTYPTLGEIVKDVWTSEAATQMFRRVS